jgi:hypothetical protein
MKSKTLNCPLCSNTLTADQIVVDEFLSKILSETNENVKKINVVPGGKWSSIIENTDEEDETSKPSSDKKIFQLPTSEVDSAMTGNHPLI